MKSKLHFIFIAILLIIIACVSADGATPPMPRKPALHSPKGAQQYSGVQMVRGWGRARAVIIPAPTTATLLWVQPCEPMLMPMIEALVLFSTDLKNWAIIQVLPVTGTNLSTTVDMAGTHGFWKVGWRWKGTL